MALEDYLRNRCHPGSFGDSIAQFRLYTRKRRSLFEQKRFLEGRQPLEPLYTVEHVKQALTQFQKVPYNSAFGIDDDIEIQLYDAGHILGASTVYLRLKENNKITRIAYSGDVGRYGETILRSPQPFPQADYIIIESTYGDRLHQDADPPEDYLYEQIVETCLKKKAN